MLGEAWLKPICINNDVINNTHLYRRVGRERKRWGGGGGGGGEKKRNRNTCT